MNIKISKILLILFVIMLIEIVLGGGGRLIEIGHLTLRMYLFFISLIISSVWFLYHNNIKRYVFSLVIIYTLIVSLGAFIGLSNHAPTDLLYEDVKPLSYFYSILFFSLIIKDENQIRLISTLIKYLSVILATLYFTILILIGTGVVNFLDFYKWGLDSGEFYFRIRSIMFYYKGFLYLNIGLIFFIAEKTKWSKFFAIFLGVSIVLTLTRSYILSTIITVVLYFILFDQKVLNKINISILVLIGLVITILVYEQYFSDRAVYSDQIRITQINQVMSKVNILSFFTGHGFGIGVPIRPVHLEISYLEIFHKQGIIGLLFWILLLGYIIFYYVKIPNIQYKKQLVPFMLGTFLVYIQTFMNPYLNNPIGMSFVLITLISVKALYLNSTDLSQDKDVRRI